MPGKRKRSTTRVRASEQKWLKAAIEVLVEEGVENIKIERLAASLGGTKGSFYYAYRDRQELLDAVLDHFVEVNHKRFLDMVKQVNAAPSERLWMLLEATAGKELREYDWAVRKWADTDPKAAELLSRIDQERLSTLMELFGSMGFDPEESFVRAALAYYAALGARAVSKEFPAMDIRLKRRKLAFKVLTCRTDGETR